MEEKNVERTEVKKREKVSWEKWMLWERKKIDKNKAEEREIEMVIYNRGEKKEKEKQRNDKKMKSGKDERLEECICEIKKKKKAKKKEIRRVRRSGILISTLVTI